VPADAPSRLALPGTPWQLAGGRAEGEAPLLVYLHGLGCAATRDWPPVRGAPALAGRASLWVDLPGFGESPRPQGFSHALPELARLLAGLLAREARPLALVGHSMGGTLALLLAERLLAQGRPVHALLLAEPNLRAEDATGSAAAAALPLADFVAGWEAWVQASGSAHHRGTLALADPEAFHRSAVSLVTEGRGLLPRLQALAVPVKGYVLGGRSDAVTHETARQVAEAGVPVARVERSGHLFSEDDPEGFAAALAGLLGGGARS
jgi:pimeloyl-ACP methyl ester carboxylesterase